MIAAVDAHYREGSAKFVCLTFHNWEDEAPAGIFTEITQEVAEYVPGEFYKRELPGMLAVLRQIDRQSLECVIVDGFVFLDDSGRPGLGWHLYQQLGLSIPVVGVAKTPFYNNKKHTKTVQRGDSKKPLYVTSIGMEVDEAARLVQHMHGAFRMPTLLRRLDGETKMR